MDSVSFIKFPKHVSEGGNHLLISNDVSMGKAMMTIGHIEGSEVRVTSPVLEALINEVTVLLVSGEVMIKLRD